MLGSADQLDMLESSRAVLNEQVEQLDIEKEEFVKRCMIVMVWKLRD